MRSAARVLLGAAVLAGSAAGQTELYRLDGVAAGDEFGFSVAVIGDVDGDGADDFVVGAPRSGAQDAGRAYVFSGTDGTLLHTRVGLGTNDFFGYSVAAPGDLDGDGVPDWVVSAPELWFEPGCVAGGYDWSTVSGKGYAVAYSGRTGAQLYLVAPSTGNANGLSLGVGGDIDGDQVPDFILCGITARLISGASGAEFRQHTFASSETYSAAIVFDLNGTGKGDYVLGTNGFCGNGNGRLRAYRGPTGAQMWSSVASGLLVEYGFSVMSPGDLDGDGRVDVIGGGLMDGGWMVYAQGMLRPVSGVDGAPFFQQTGTAWSALGYALEPLGDLGQDGSPEYAVSAPGLEAACGGEPVRVYTGSTPQVLLTIPPDDVCDRFGGALSAGDVNGDGLTDLLVGARWDDDGGADAGSVKVFSLFLGPTVYCEAEVNSQGCTPSIFATGTPSLAANSFRVKAANVLNQRSGLMFWGSSPKQAAFGGGYKCVAPPTRRTALQNSGGSPQPPDDCSGTYSFHWNGAYVASQGLSAGDDVYCQYWSRDAQSASTTNLTDALAFTLLP